MRLRNGKEVGFGIWIILLLIAILSALGKYCREHYPLTFPDERR